jgi:hypothetical protein
MSGSPPPAVLARRLLETTDVVPPSYRRASPRSFAMSPGRATATCRRRGGRSRTSTDVQGHPPPDGGWALRDDPALVRLLRRRWEGEPGEGDGPAPEPDDDPYGDHDEVFDDDGLLDDPGQPAPS